MPKSIGMPAWVVADNLELAAKKEYRSGYSGCTIERSGPLWARTFPSQNLH
ncbi:MAG: hypothetical protein HC842_02790 [Cytophagales bacterium]|nr:hypothetical protein [Cytophagales bacterium]